jgi:glycosyltransferase involved in cell wall biosynthesis
LCAISGNAAARLQRFNGLRAQVVHPPPPHAGRYVNRGSGDYVLSVGRLEPLKRVDLLISAIALADRRARCLIVGTGPAEPELRALLVEHHLEERVSLLGRVEDSELLRLYGEARAVFYGPFDEDYGYVALEAMASGKPVITLSDAGGPLEFVVPGETGWVTAPEAGALAAAIDEALEDPAKCESLGRRGQERVAPITWDAVAEALLGG